MICKITFMLLFYIVKSKQRFFAAGSAANYTSFVFIINNDPLKTWKEAQAACLQRGGHLALIEKNIDQVEHMKKYLNVILDLNIQYYIGLCKKNDKQISILEMYFATADSNSLKYHNSEHTCGIITKQKNDSYSMKFTNCENKKRYLCQRLKADTTIKRIYKEEYRKRRKIIVKASKAESKSHEKNIPSIAVDTLRFFNTSDLSSVTHLVPLALPQVQSESQSSSYSYAIFILVLVLVALFLIGLAGYYLYLALHAQTQSGTYGYGYGYTAQGNANPALPATVPAGTAPSPYAHLPIQPSPYAVVPFAPTLPQAASTQSIQSISPSNTSFAAFPSPMFNQPPVRPRLS